MKRLGPGWYRWAAALVAGLCAMMLSASGAMTPVDDALYAAYVRNAPLARDGKTVLIAIDDRSLQELEQWPWSRRTHARLVALLDAAGARSIALDILMPERDRDPGSDDALAQAMRTSGRVVLPVNAGTAATGAPAEELVPVAPLADAARALGHTDLESGQDSASALYLKAGIGVPRWPALALALLSVERNDLAVPPRPGRNASRAWERTDRVLLRFSGPAGTYPQYSYVDVLEGRVPDDAFRGRRVIVGATAAGLGQAIATPMPGGRMSALEYVANATETLAQGAQVRALDSATCALLAFLAATLAAGLALQPAPRQRLLANAFVVMGLVAVSLVAVSAARTWWGPSSAVVAIVLFGAVSIVVDLRRSTERAHLDGVTGLLSRRRFLHRLRGAIAHAADTSEPLAVVSLEFSGFERYRAHAGELEAAVLLARLAKLMHAELDGAGDFAGRTSDAGLAGALLGRSDAAVDAIVDRLRAQATDVVLNAEGNNGATALQVHVGRARATSDAWLPLLRRAMTDGRKSAARA